MICLGVPKTHEKTLGFPYPKTEKPGVWGDEDLAKALEIGQLYSCSKCCGLLWLGACDRFSMRGCCPSSLATNSIAWVQKVSI